MRFAKQREASLRVSASVAPRLMIGVREPIQRRQGIMKAAAIPNAQRTPLIAS